MNRFDQQAVGWLKAFGLAGRIRCVDVTRDTDCDGLRLGLCYEGTAFRALAANRLPADVCRVLAQEGIDPPVDLMLVLDDTGCGVLYHRYGADWKPVPKDQIRQRLDEGEGQIKPSLARRVVATIGSRHRRELEGHLLPPMLRVLDRNFPRADLYLFELLQNAVDDGAMQVEFRVEDHRLVVRHDGSRFTAVDVLGLSSVGLSGKAGRTIGFLGIGFKAVYRRFDRVRISDDVWSFQFERPAEAEHSGWKVIPEWRNGTAREPAPTRGCRFDLECPIGGISAVKEDLTSLPPEVPVLLGRRALLLSGNAVQEWCLNWNGERWTVSQVKRMEDDFETFRVLRQHNGETDTTYWTFISVLFDPSTDKEAREAYRKFRDEPDADPDKQEVTLFFKVDEHGQTDRNDKGRTFAVLPTELALPDGMGFHLQANWLPTLDRQGIQRPKENAWNASLARKLPDLLLRLLRWLASGSAGNPSTAYAMLPSVQNGNLRLYGLTLDLTTWLETIRTEGLVPVLPLTSSDENALEFVPAGGIGEGRVVDVPAAFVGLEPEFLQAWLGRRFFAGERLHGGERFWRSLGVLEPLGAVLVEQRSQNLTERFRSRPDEQARLREIVRLLKAFHRTRMAGGPVRVQAGLDDWRVFPTSEGDLANQRDVVRVKPTYLQDVPAELRSFLQPYCAPHGRRLLDPALQQALNEEAGTPALEGQDEARTCITELVRVVAGRDIFARFFDHMRQGTPGEQEVRRIIQFTRWAFEENRHSLVTAILVETPSGVLLLSPENARLGETYGGTASEPATAAVPPIAAAYLTAEVEVEWWAEGFRRLLPATPTGGSQLPPQAVITVGAVEDGQQALYRLRNLWQKRPEPADATARRTFVDALCLLARERRVAQATNSEPNWLNDWQHRRNQGDVLAYCHSPDSSVQRWLPLAGVAAGPLPVYNDSPRKAACLEQQHCCWAEALLSRIPDLELRKDAVDLLGLARLSDDVRFPLDIQPDGPSEEVPELSRRFAVLLRLLSRLRQDDPEAMLPASAEPVLRRCRAIRRTLAGLSVSAHVSAAWRPPGEVLLCGLPMDYLQDLRDETEAQLGFDRPEERHLLAALMYLEDSKRFQQELDKRAKAVNAERVLKIARKELPEQSVTVASPNAHDNGGTSGVLAGAGERETGKPSAPSSVSSASEAEGVDKTNETPQLPPAPRVLDLSGTAERKRTAPTATDATSTSTAESVEKVKSEGPSKSATGTTPGREGYAGFRVLCSPHDGGLAAEQHAGSSNDDTVSRAIVIRFENAHSGWHAEAAHQNQRGYDVVSTHESGLVRRIEVKGVTGEWRDHATVQMTAPQFHDSRAGVEYWLYVVDRIETRRPRIRAFRQIACRVEAFYFQGGDWEGYADEVNDVPLDELP